MRRLIVLPERPGDKSGYQKAVSEDLKRLQITAEDVVICYTHDLLPVEDYGTFYLIKRPSRFSIKRACNLLQRRVSNELWVADLEKCIKNLQFDYIFCGEVTLYKALRKLFPSSLLIVRFHNFFSLVLLRNEFLDYSLHPIIKLNFYLLAKLEKEILSDKNILPIFITEEECNFFRIIFPSKEVHVWKVVTSDNLPKNSIKDIEKPLLIWFGGLSAHKVYSVKYFIENVYIKIKAAVPEVEFHLYGSGTEKISNPALHIYGHGFYESSALPFHGKALFINPDLLGGGVKIKVKKFLLAGVPFITTPFGFEGYEIIESEKIIIRDINNWAQTIISYFNALSKK